MPLWFGLSLLSALAWGIGQILVKVALVRYHSSVVYFAFSVVNLAAVACLVLFSGPIEVQHLPLVLVLSLASCVGRIFYFKAAKEAPMSLVGTVVASYPMFTVALAAFFLGEETTAIQKLCVGLIVGGTALMSWAPEGRSERPIPAMRWLPLSLTAALAFGAGGFFSKWGIMETGRTFMLGASLNQIWISGGWLLGQGPLRRWEWTYRQALLLVACASLFTTGSLSVFLALETGPSSLVFPISSGCTLITLVLAFLFLREQLTLVQWAGAVMASLGIIWIGWA